MGFKFDKLPTNPLVGARWGTLREVVRGKEIDFKGKYRLTAAICALLNLGRPLEEFMYKLKVEKMQLDDAPLFILGHWRSGTTFVHNVFCKDKQFGYTTTYQTVFPNIMLSGQWFFRRCMAVAMPDKRPTDNMELNPNLPQEEEFAMSNLMPYSFYHFWYFPRHTQEYADKYLTFETCSEREREIYKREFVRMVKTSLHNTGGKRFLSKNPPHTGHIREILEMFPNARFVYLIRNPYTVFESTRSYFTNVIEPLKLQRITPEQIEENIIQTYTKLYRRYEEQKHLIPEGHLIEIKFEDFEADPLAMTERIYNELSLGGFEEARPAIEAYIGAKKGYKKNAYRYEERTRRIVEENWGYALKDWGYEL